MLWHNGLNIQILNHRLRKHNYLTIISLGMNECSVATLAFLISYFWDQEATANKESIYGENETTIYYLYIFFIRLQIVLEIFTCLKYIIASKIKCKLQLQVNR